MQSDSLSHRLLPNERLLWSGIPRQGLVLTARDWFLIPFSIMWGGFAIFWETSVLGIVSTTRIEHSPATAGASIFMALWGVPIVLIGLFMMFGRFFLDALLRERITYALTDQRILITRRGPFASFSVLGLGALWDVTLNEGTNGRGTIRFCPRGSLIGRGSAGAGSWIAALDSTPQFLQIEDVRRVFDLIQQYINKTR